LENFKERKSGVGEGIRNVEMYIMWQKIWTRLRRRSKDELDLFDL
jgi:hypothetical protein